MLKLKNVSGGNYDEQVASSSAGDFRLLLEQQQHRPIPYHIFIHYAKTLSDYDKCMLALTLKLPFSRRDLRKWPDLLFFKKLSLLIKKSVSDYTIRKQFLIYLANNMMIPQPELTDLQHNLNQYIDKYSYWNVYWTVYFHLDCEQEQLRENVMNQLMNMLEKQTLVQGQDELAVTFHEAHLATDDISKLEKKIDLLEDKINKETTTRQQLEIVLAQKEKLQRQLQSDHEKLQLLHAELKTELDSKEEIQLKQLKQVQDAQLRWREEQERWLEERAQFLTTIKLQQEELKKNQHAASQLEKELEESKKQAAHWQQLITQKQQQELKPSTNERQLHQQLSLVTHSLLLKVNQYNQSLLQAIEQKNQPDIEQGPVREQIRKVLHIIDEIEQFQLDEASFHKKPTTVVNDNQTDLTALSPSQEAVSKTEKSQQLDKDHMQETNEQLLYGTFYRRDHGGYISLESGETFNITESLVQQLELQHEAEVLCTPTAHSGRNNHYTIELLFQGDDNYSPVQQYDGFVQLDEDMKWYCIDLNDESNRYPIHFKDIEIQKPAHGDPCTFNVAEDGFIARLTRLYRLHGEALDVHPARKKSDKPKEQTAISNRKKPDPFLDNCTITIIGGQKKWFESVVTETGAQLVHDGGEHPERISSDLSRSQALFMILTSTSHRATWEGIEIAKTNNIPHFIIQGSKSNLRTLLWDNQEMIRNTNRCG